MNVLIAGASGFIGKNLTKYLNNKHEIQTLSLRDADWRREIKTPHVFINLIGKAHDHKGTGTKSNYDFVNVELTKILFKSFEQSSASLFIHISSLAAVEEVGSSDVVHEDSASNPISYYGKSKKEAEDYLLSQNLGQGKRLIILRPTMVHGPGDKGNLSLLFKFVNYGIPYPLGAFDNKRSFLGIDNLCFIIDEILTKQIPGGVYHIADDTPVSTKEIIRTIALASKKRVKILAFPKVFVIGLAKLGDYLKLPLNSSRLKKLTTNLIVSNNKIKHHLHIAQLPNTAMQGMIKTIDSFLNK